MECARCLANMAQLDNIQYILWTAKGRTKMNHPLTPDLSQLSDSDLMKKQTELQKRMIYGHQTGNSNMISQLELMLNDYRAESQRRDHKRYQEENENAESKGKNWDDLIDI